VTKFYTTLLLIFGFNLKLNCSETKEIKEKTQVLLENHSTLVVDCCSFNVVYSEICNEFLKSLPMPRKLLFSTYWQKRPKNLYISSLFINKHKEIVIKVKVKLNGTSYDKYFFYDLNGRIITKNSNDYQRTIIDKSFLEENPMVTPDKNKVIKLYPKEREIRIFFTNGTKINSIKFDSINNVSLYDNILVIAKSYGEITIYTIE